MRLDKHGWKRMGIECGVLEWGMWNMGRARVMRMWTAGIGLRRLLLRSDLDNVSFGLNYMP